MPTISCKINQSPSVGSSFFQYSKTVAFCTTSHPFEGSHRDIEATGPFIDVKWHDENLNNKNMVSAYYQNIMKNIIEKIIHPFDANKTIVFRFNIINHSEYALMCAINSCVLAMLDLGIPIKNVFYATGTLENLKVYLNEEVIYTHSFGSKEQSEPFDIVDAITKCVDKYLTQELF